MGFRFVLPGRFSFGVYNVRACVYMLPGFDIVERCNRTKSGDSLFFCMRVQGLFCFSVYLAGYIEM